MNQIESQSYRASHRARNFFVPSFAQVILYILIGSILLVLFGWSNVLGWLGNHQVDPAGSLKAGWNELENGFSSSFSSALGGRLGQIIVWSFVGAATYIGLWFARNLINSFENDVIVDHYLHPGNYNRLGYWQSALAGKIFFGASALVLLAYLFLWAKVLLPAAAAVAASAAYNFHPTTSPLYILICVVISSLAVYVLALIAKVVAHLWGLL